jgi:phosphohistidine phosphatase SixA
LTSYLIRHAHAGSRSEWDQPDRSRPLSDRGTAQAEAIREALADRPVDRILTSPARRCVQTVEPLAEARGLRIEESGALFEGSDPAAGLDLLTELAGENVVFCSHGDLIPDLIRLLTLRGLETTGRTGNKKGSIWVLESDKGHFVKAEYLPPD